MGDLYEAVDRLRAEHQASVHQTAGGWRWSCSCGREGTRSPAGAQAAMSRHLQAEYDRLLSA